MSSSSVYGVANPDAVYARYAALQPPIENGIQLEYIWIGGSGHDVRSKTKTWLKGEPKCVREGMGAGGGPPPPLQVPRGAAHLEL